MTKEQEALAKSAFNHLAPESKEAYTKRLAALVERATTAADAFADWSDKMSASNARESIPFTLAMHAVSMKLEKVITAPIPDHIKILRTAMVCGEFARACRNALPATTRKYAPDASCEWMDLSIRVMEEMLTFNEELKLFVTTQN